MAARRGVLRLRRIGEGRLSLGRSGLRRWALRGSRAGQSNDQAEGSQNGREKRKELGREGRRCRDGFGIGVKRGRGVDEGLSAKNLIFWHGTYTVDGKGRNGTAITGNLR